MFSLNKKVFDFQDTLYILKRTIKEENISSQFIHEYKEWIGCDTVLKKDGLYYFSNKIEEVQIIPEKGQLKLDF